MLPLFPTQGVLGLRGEQGQTGRAGLKVKVKLAAVTNRRPKTFLDLSKPFLDLIKSSELCTINTFSFHQGLPGDPGVLGPVGPPGLKVAQCFVKILHQVLIICKRNKCFSPQGNPGLEGLRGLKGHQGKHVGFISLFNSHFVFMRQV